MHLVWLCIVMLFLFIIFDLIHAFLDFIAYMVRQRITILAIQLAYKFA